MNNQHNPIAVRIDAISDLWEKNKSKNPNIKLFDLICNSNDYPLVEGFLKLASSKYSKLTDTFIVFDIDFTTISDFYYKLIREWIKAFELDLKRYPDWNWEEFEFFKEEFNNIPYNANKLKIFFIEIMKSFKQFEGRNDSDLILTLTIKKVIEVNELYATLEGLHKDLPENIVLLLIDSKERDIYTKMIEKSFEDNAVIIEIPDQNMLGACEELATQGNPNDPHIEYRKCLFDMGKAAQNNKKDKLKKLGENLIKISEKIRDVNLIASAHLIYAGFLFQFKESKLINKLLNRGVEILEPYYTQQESSANIYIQLLIYKGSYRSIEGRKKEAIKLFVNAAKISEKLNLPILVINSYNYALLLALKKERNIYERILIDAFDFGYSQSDDYLKSINLTFIVSNYIEKIDVVTENERNAIIRRMNKIYGEDWQLTSKELGKKLMAEYSVR